MQQTEKKIVKIYLWLMLGLLLSAGAALMKSTGSTDVNNLMNQAEVYDFSKEQLMDADEIKELPSKRRWNYLQLEIESLPETGGSCGITVYNKKGKVLGEQTEIVFNGKNQIELSYQEPFKYIGVVVNDAPDSFILPEKMQLRMNLLLFQEAVFLPVFFLLFGGYLVLTVYPVFRKRKLSGRSGFIGILQYAYALPGNYLGSRLGGRIKERQRNVARTLLFMTLFLSGMLMEISGNYLTKESYKYGVLFETILLILIALLSWERKLQPKKWEGALVTAWFFLWIWVCISDFVVSKYFKFTGYVFLIAVGFLFYFWNHMSRPEGMREDMLRGLRLTFGPLLVYTLIFRKRYVGIFYNGAFSNREAFAFYALALLLAFLWGLYIEWRKVKERQRKIGIVLYAAGAGLCVYFLYRASVTACMVAAGVLIVVFSGCFLFLLWKGKIPFPVLLVAAVASVICVLGVDKVTLYLPDALGTNVKYQQEVLETNLEEAAIAEIENVLPGYFSSVIRISNYERMLIYENYAGRLSFFGNKEPDVIVSGKETFAYSGWLEMVYRYGIMVMIPYVLLFFACLWCGWKRKDIFTIALALLFLIVMAIQNIELPFLHPLWFLFYLNMGQLFFEKKAE